MPSSQPPNDEDADFLTADDALEEITPDEDQPISGVSDDEQADEEVVLHNDSIAHFDGHRDSVFAIAQHPTRPTLIATGGSEGPEDDAPGMGYLVDTSAAPERPVLPASFNSTPTEGVAGVAQTTTLEPLARMEGHTDSITALAWGLPNGEVLFTGGMDGRLAAWLVGFQGNTPRLELLGDAQEVKEVTWLAACPNTTHPNAVALGADDGSVWVYTASLTGAADHSDALAITQSYFLHTSACTAGVWTPDGNLLVTVSEDGSLYAWDVWGVAAQKGLTDKNGTTAVSLTVADGRFAVEEGLFSVAVEPKGTYVAVGGAGGAIRVVSLPLLHSGAGTGKQAKVTPGGQILASLNVQPDSIESLSFTAIAPSTTLLAAGCVDGSVAVFEASRQFATRRQIPSAHDGLSVVKVEFLPGTWSLTTCGMDGAVRRWDLHAGGGARGNAVGTVAEAGLVGEWRGHRGGGEGGGVMGFVQGTTGTRIVTAGDDGLVLVFDA